MPKKDMFESTETQGEAVSEETVSVVDVAALQAEIEALKADNAHLHAQITEYNAWLTDESEFIHVTYTDFKKAEVEVFLDPAAVSSVMIDPQITHRGIRVYIHHGYDCLSLTTEQWEILKPKLLAARKKRAQS